VELLAEERSVDELAAAVAERFDVDTSRAHSDVQSFVDEMAQMDCFNYDRTAY